MTHESSSPSSDLDDPREDVLLDRVARLEATAEDWTELAGLAASDATIWTRVTAVLAGREAIDRLAASAVASAARVELPVRADAVSGPSRARSSAGAHPIVRLAARSGWAVAAVLALAASLQWWLATSPTSPDASLPGAPSLGATEALAEYLRAGRLEGIVIGELPPLTLAANPSTEDPGFDVTYVRRIVERVHVDDGSVFRLASDELGRAVTVPARDPLGSPRNPL